MEKIYKTMQGTGVINIVIGSVIITVGLAAGVMAIVSGAFLLKRIETIQLVFKVGSFDVDDMFLNTLGGIAGYLCQWITRAIGRCLHGTSNR